MKFSADVEEDEGHGTIKRKPTAFVKMRVPVDDDEEEEEQQQVHVLSNFSFILACAEFSIPASGVCIVCRLPHGLAPTSIRFEILSACCIMPSVFTVIAPRLHVMICGSVYLVPAQVCVYVCVCAALQLLRSFSKRFSCSVLVSWLCVCVCACACACAWLRACLRKCVFLQMLPRGTDGLQGKQVKFSASVEEDHHGTIKRKPTAFMKRTVVVEDDDEEEEVPTSIPQPSPAQPFYHFSSACL